MKQQFKLSTKQLVFLALMAAMIAGFRDANGRILTAARYENSVYQVFRPEVAGG